MVIESKIIVGELVAHRAAHSTIGILSCVRTVSKLYLFSPLGLAFERKTDAPKLL